MSKRETLLTHRYWNSVGGTLVEEFMAVSRRAGVGRRLIDAVILPKSPHCVARSAEVDLKGQDVIVVQTKASRLGMNVMGQAVFSAELVRKFEPASVNSVITFTADDLVLRPLLDRFLHVEVIMMDGA